MPRSGSKRKTTQSPAPARKSSRSAAAPPPVESPSPRKGRRAASPESPAPRKSTRKASPSPVPVARTQSRGRSARTATKQETKESPAQKKTRGKSQQGQGDEELKGRGRVTRAVVQEAETKGKSRSATRESKTDKPAQSRSTSRQKKTAAASKVGTPKSKGKTTTPKGGKRRSKADEEDEEESEEEEEEEIETPKSKTKAAKEKKPTPKSVSKKATPKKAAKSPSPKKPAAKSSPKGRSSSRGKKSGPTTPRLENLAEPQLVLTKIDDSPALSPEKRRVSASPKKIPTQGSKSTPSPRRARSRGSPTEKNTESSPKGTAQESEKTEKVELEDSTKGANTEEVADTGEETMNTEEMKEEEPKVGEMKTIEQESEQLPEKDESAMETDQQNITGKSEDSAINSAPTEEEQDMKQEEVNEISKKTEEESEVLDEVAEDEKIIPGADDTESKEEEAPPVVDEEMEAKDVCDGKEQSGKEECEPVVANASTVEQANGTSQDTTDAVSPSRKRKFEEMNDHEDEDISPKKVKLVDEESITQENGEQITNETEVIEETVCQSEDMSNNKEEVMETEVQTEVPSASTESDISKDYVVVDMQEVPAADSEEVLGSLPKAATEVTEVTTEVQNPVLECPPQESEVAIEQPVPVPECLPVENEVLVEQPLSNDETIQLEQKTSQENVVESVPEAEKLVVENNQAATSSPDHDWVTNRTFIPNPAFNYSDSDIAKQFNIVSYNILAQCHLERNDYSFTAPEFLLQNQRHAKMMEELQYLDGDVVCMQEVGPTYYEDVLYPSMKSLGYEGLMMKRTDDYYEEGEATFYRASRFTLVDFQTYSLAKLAEKELDGLEDGVKKAIRKYLDRPDVLIVAQFKCNKTESIITVGNTHIHWGRMEVPDVQSVQIVSSIKELMRKAGGSTSAYILCGDFNSEVTSAGYQLSTEGKLSDDMMQKLLDLKNIEMPNGETTSLLSQIMPAFQLTCGLRSSYKAAQGHEPVITSYNQVMRAAVDYIFYSDHCVDNVGVLEVPPEQAVTGTGGIPDEVFPSDHVSIKATFSFR